ncbi:unnamed protein product [Paramecium sonneborni]|uniref:WD40-repeat-containing domain n=1 Tax=Paramecium sonneborni TaxID=65129 RepID=A0A8S1QX96_9CILI|nr:unnamed protein product [Paramecium sonneborni]
MSQNQEKKLCKAHNLQIIATDLKESCNEESRYLCAQCLTQKVMQSTIHINEDAESFLNDIKTDYQQTKSQNIEKTQNVLNQLQACIDDLKRNLVLICEKISQQINQETDRLSKLLENLDQTVKSIDIYNFNELFPKLQNEDLENSKNSFKSILQSQLVQIQENQKFQEFNQLLNSFEFQTGQLEFYQSEQQQQLSEENQTDTPGLKVLCQSHNKEIIAFDLDPERAKENRLACIYCIEENAIKYVSLTKVQKQWNQLEEIKKKKLEALQQKHSENEQVIVQQLNVFTEVLKQKNQEITDYLKEHNSIMNNIVNSALQGMNQNWQKFQKKNILDIIETLSTVQLNEEITFKQEKEILQQEIQLKKSVHDSFQKLKETYISTLQKISEKICWDNDLISFNTIKLQNKELIQTPKEIEFNIQMQCGLKQQNIKQIQTQTEQQALQQGSINYLMLQNHAIKQNDNFRALSFTKENDFLIAGCNKQIHIYKFCWGQLELIQQIDKHEQNICSIYSMKKSKSFITGDFNGKIIVWIYDENKWKSQAEVKEHSDFVNQILLNKDENEMITCSDDKTIKFYTKEQQQWKCVQTIKNHINNVHAISLNPSENTLISCGFDNIISILVKDFLQKEWQMKQTIKCEQYGYRICFFKNNSFFFQPQGQQKMQLFQKSSQNGEFEKTKEFEVNKLYSSCSRWFQMEYQVQNQLLLCKNGNCVNLFKVQDDCTLKAEQTITFETSGICGALTNDTLYLILWDDKSKQFQIRKQFNE